MSVILVDNAYFGHALRRAPRDGGETYHPKPWRRVKHELRVTTLSLRRSTNNVENVGVRLWQSRL